MLYPSPSVTNAVALPQPSERARSMAARDAVRPAMLPVMIAGACQAGWASEMQKRLLGSSRKPCHRTTSSTSTRQCSRPYGFGSFSMGRRCENGGRDFFWGG
jgi:hypothetical protein